MSVARLISFLHPVTPCTRKLPLPLCFLNCPIIPRSSSYSSHCRCQTERNPYFSLLSQSPPVPKKVPFKVSAAGRTWQDPYHWMSDTKDADLADYLNRENSYAESFMADTENLQRKLLSEMKSRTPPQISTPPELWGPWLYYQHIPEGKEYPVLCRKLVDDRKDWIQSSLAYMDELREENVLLDWNQIAELYGYVHVGTCRVSPIHDFLAYTIDKTGDECFMLQIKDLKKGCLLSKIRVARTVSLAWAPDSATLFYTISDETHRPYRVLYINLESDAAESVTIFTESDSSYCVDITSTKDGKFVTVNSNSRTSSEVYVIDAVNHRDRLQRIHKRALGVQFFVEHHCGFFYALTNAPYDEKKPLSGDYYLARCQVKDIRSPSWQILIYPSKDIILRDVDIFRRHLVLFLDIEASPMMCSINMPIDNEMKIEDLNPWFFPVPSKLCNIVPGSNHDFMSSVYRAVVSSPVMPDAIVDYDMSKRKCSILKQEEVVNISDKTASFSLSLDTKALSDLQNSVPESDQCIGGIQWWKDFSNKYYCERKEVMSHDGVGIPLTILYSREKWKMYQSPGLLHGYGAYGEVLDKSWCPDRISLLDRGWVIAFADVRGGGGGGSSWHKFGSGLSKHNSILDFVSSGKYLVNEGYVHKDLLSAIGFSAGGLLVGAAINMHLDMFRAAILKVPFLDIRNTLLDSTLPLTILDYEEFGDPRTEPHLISISSYSPYDNITPGGCYPSMLITASFHDSRVGVWEAGKWVAKVRDSTCPSCSLHVILKTNMSGGHFGEGGRLAQCEDMAYEYAFLMKVMGICD